MLEIIIILVIICLSYIAYNFKKYNLIKDSYTPTIKNDNGVINRIIPSQIRPKPDIKVFHSYNHADPTEKSSAKNILFDGEAHQLYNDSKTFDFVLTTKLKDVAENSVYIPVWTYHIPCGLGLEDLLKKRNQYEKTKFCAFMHSNCSAKERNDFFDMLHSKKYVDALGSCKKNTNTPVTRTEHNWGEIAVELYKPYKFVMAFENTINMDGYITEKLILPLISGCIPIYYGAKQAKEQFNPDCFIDVSDFKTFDDCIEYILKVDNDPELYSKYVNAHITTKDKLQKYAEWYYGSPNFYDKLYKVFPEIKRSRYKPLGIKYNLDPKCNIKIINLNSSKDRWKSMVKQFSKYPYLKYERFPAVNGSKYAELYKKYIDSSSLGRNFSYGEIGIYLSTMEVFNILLNDESNDYYVILEDDIFLPEKNMPKIEDIVKDAPIGWDIIFLGYNNMYGCNPSSKYERFTAGCMPGNFALIVRKKAAQYLSNFIFPIDFPIDENYRVHSVALEIYMYYPQLIKTDYSIKSTVHDTGYL